ncbi:MAG: DUF2332 domain-containing protein [Candidatus Dormibacteria bacterium]
MTGAASEPAGLPAAEQGPRWGDPGPDGHARRDFVAAQFRDFVRQTESDGSRLYARLSAAVADDDALLALADRALPGQRRPNLFFAAVRLLLLRHPEEPLAAFHPDIAGRRPPADGPGSDDPVALLGELCLRRRDELLAEITTRLVQTNEPRRCVVIRPGLQAIAQREGVTELAVCDVGTSAGFTLRMNRFGYDYGAGRRVGDLGAALQLACELRGPLIPPCAAPLHLGWRTGIDLDPIDVDDPDSLSWLEALIWPGDAERLRRVRLAAEAVRADPLRIRTGNAAGALPAAAADAPPHLPLVVITTYALAHFSHADRELFGTTIAGVARDRPVWWLTTAGRNELDRSGVELRARRLHAGAVREDVLLCTHHPHGVWLEWIDPATAAAVGPP